jgi:hypothetical protein
MHYSYWLRQNSTSASPPVLSNHIAQYHSYKTWPHVITDPGWKQSVPPKHGHPPTRLRGVTTQKIITWKYQILTAKMYRYL